MNKDIQPPPYSPPHQEQMMNMQNSQNIPTPNPNGFQYAPLPASSPSAPPSTVTNVVVTSGRAHSGCPVCGNSHFTGTYPCHAWLCCLFCSWAACLGCIWCLCMRRKKCTKCGFQIN